MRIIKSVLVLPLVASLAFGCASVGKPIDQSAANRIKKGVTTRDQVLAAMGSPDEIIKVSNGDTTFSYIHARSQIKPETFIPIVGAFAGGTNVQKQTLMVTFGTDGIVKDILNTQGATEVGLGISSSQSKAPLDEVEKNKRGS